MQPDDDDFVYIDELNRRYIPNSALKKKESEDKMRGSMDPLALLGLNNDNNNMIIHDTTTKPNSPTMNNNSVSNNNNAVANNSQIGKTNTLSTTAPTTPVTGTTTLMSPSGEKSVSMKKIQSNKMLDKSISMKASLSSLGKNDLTKSKSSKVLTGAPLLPKISSKMGGEGFARK